MSSVLSDSGSVRTISVVLRYDDYSAESPTLLEQNMVDLLREYRARVVLGVVPFVNGGDQHDLCLQPVRVLPTRKAAILARAAQEGIVEVALHGFTHQTRRSRYLFGWERGYAEMQGQSLERQTHDIAVGLSYLEQACGGSIMTFMPPWNLYDGNTLRAMQFLGLRILSADQFGVVNDALSFVPATTDLFGCRAAIERTRETADTSPIIVVIFHPTDLLGDPECLGGLRDLLPWLTQQPDVQFHTPASLQAAGHDLSARRLRLNSYWLARASISVLARARSSFIDRLMNGMPVGVYLSAPAATVKRRPVVARRTVASMGVFALSMAIAFVVASVLPRLICLAALAVLSAIACNGVYRSSSSGIVRVRTFLLLVLATGGTVGCIVGIALDHLR